MQANWCMRSAEFLWHEVSLISVEFTSKRNVALIVGQQGDGWRRWMRVSRLRSFAANEKLAGIIIGFQVTGASVGNVLLLVYHWRRLWRWSMVVVIVWRRKRCSRHSRIWIWTKRWRTRRRRTARHDRLIRTRSNQGVSGEILFSYNTHIFALNVILCDGLSLFMW